MLGPVNSRSLLCYLCGINEKSFLAYNVSQQNSKWCTAFIQIQFNLQLPASVQHKSENLQMILQQTEHRPVI
nr:hypothetical protein Q903MT_gene2271 [Picea sitchensis]